MNNVYESLPPNFLDSILSNDSLYAMFKNDFDNNREYFQNVSKDIYIKEIEKYICKKFENYNGESTYLNYYKRFYDDFILPIIRESEESIFTFEIFKILKMVYRNNELNSEDFIAFYNYVFSSSNYFEISDKIISRIESIMENGELSITDYEILNNYIKNTVDEYIKNHLSCLLIKNHVYKYNHIFDTFIVKKIVLSIANDFFRKYGIRVNIEYTDIILSKNVKTHDVNNFTIYLDSILIDTFISGNYVELLSSLFYKLMLLKDDYLICNNVVGLDTLKALWKLVNAKVELDKIFVDIKYHPYDYYSDMEANAFIMTLRFLGSIGINLFDNYLNSQMRDLNLEIVDSKSSSKEIPEEMRFINRFSKMEKEKIAYMRKKYKVLEFFYDEFGKRKKAIELLNKWDIQYKNIIFDYLSFSIAEPNCIIEDIIDITNQKFNNGDVENFVMKMMKYIYPDIFYYSLESYIVIGEDKISFNKDEYLSELYVRISSIKETEESRKFLKNALNAIELMKQKN